MLFLLAAISPFGQPPVPSWSSIPQASCDIYLADWNYSPTNLKSAYRDHSSPTELFVSQLLYSSHPWRWSSLMLTGFGWFCLSRSPCFGWVRISAWRWSVPYHLCLKGPWISCLETANDMAAGDGQWTSCSHILSNHNERKKCAFVQLDSVFRIWFTTAFFSRPSGAGQATVYCCVPIHFNEFATPHGSLQSVGLTPLFSAARWWYCYEMRWGSVSTRSRNN